jgi:hypothetical protein
LLSSDLLFLVKDFSLQRLYAKRNMVFGTCAGVNYNLTFCPLQNQPNTCTMGKSCARVDFIPQPWTINLASANPAHC